MYAVSSSTILLKSNPNSKLKLKENLNFIRHRVFKTSYTHFHIVVFAVTYFCSATSHINRKSLSNVKSVISEEWTPSRPDNITGRELLPDSIWNDHKFFPNDDDPALKNFLGGLDTCFMLAYSIGLFLSGLLCDRYSSRVVLYIGLFGSSVATFLFSCIGEWFNIYSYFWYIPIWAINGFFQSSQYPSSVAIMGNWFGKTHGGVVFGLWSTSFSIGNALGSFISGAVVNYGYEISMLLTALLQVSIAIIVVFGIVEKPIHVGLQESDGITPSDDDTSISEDFGTSSKVFYGSVSDSVNIISEKQPGNQLSFVKILCLPGVFIYGLVYGCVKLVHYSFFYWLPFYLNREFHWSASLSADLSIWYDLGGIFGAVLGGYVSDKLKRSPVIVTMLILAIPLLFVYQVIPASIALHSVMLFALGFFIGGVANLLPSAVASDLARQPTVKSNESVLGTVTGIVDGIGSLGAALGQILVPVIQNAFGWDAVFDIFIAACFLTLVCITPIFYNEVKEFLEEKGYYPRNSSN